MITKVSKGNIYVKNTAEETAVSNDILKLPNGLLDMDKPFKLFDMKKFQQNVNREMKRQFPERNKLETQVRNARRNTIRSTHRNICTNRIRNTSTHRNTCKNRNTHRNTGKKTRKSMSVDTRRHIPDRNKLSTQVENELLC